MEKVPGSNVVSIDKRKYLVPADITVAQFQMIIRRRLQLPQEKALFMMTGSVVPTYRYVFLKPQKFILISGFHVTKNIKEPV